MGYFCTNCGNKVNSGNFCPNCGTPMGEERTPVQNYNNYQYPTKRKVPGNGLSIAGMVLGIIAVTYFLIELMALTDLDKMLMEAKLEYGYNDFPVVAWAFGFVLLSAVPSIVGLPLSFSGMAKHKSGKNISGVILNSIGLVGSIIVFIIVINHG